VLRERAARARHHRQRRAQIVGDRSQQGVAQAFALRTHARRFGLGSEPLPLDGEPDLARKGLEQVQLLGQQHQAPVARQNREHT